MKRYLTLFALALIVRLVILYELRDVDAIPLGTDMLKYYQQSLSILRGEWPPPHSFHMHILMPWLTALSFKLFGLSTMSPRLLNVIISALACPVIVAIGDRLWSKPVGTLAGVMFAVYRGDVFHSQAILDVPSTTLAMSLLVLLVISPSLKLGMLASLVSSIAITGRASLLVVIVAAALVLAVKGQRKIAAILCAAALVVCFVIIAHNSQFGYYGLFGSSSVNFWIGNHPAARGVFVSQDPAAPDRLAYTAIVQGDQAWSHHAIEFIRSRPLDWLELTVRKILLWVFMLDGMANNNIELGDALKVSWLLHFLPGYGLYLALAFSAAVVMRRHWRRLWPLYVLYVASSASVIAFFVLSRFRVPVMPVLIVMAAIALVDIVGHLVVAFSRHKIRPRYLFK